MRSADDDAGLTVLKPSQDALAAIASVPSPLRARNADPCVSTDLEEKENLLTTCPWQDSLAHCLTLQELGHLCCTSASLRAELTVEERYDAEDQELSAEPVDYAPHVDELEKQLMRSRKMIAPLISLKAETAERDLQMVSIHNIRTLRVWNYRSLNILAERFTSIGGPTVLRSLERLSLKGCPLKPEVITTFIVPVFSSVPRLKHLNLEKNIVTDEVLCNLVESGALSIARLESLNLRFNRIGTQGATALALCTECCQALKWVNFKMNQVGDEGAIALAKMLRDNDSMTLLNLRRQMPPLTDRTAFAFAETLKYNKTLQHLRFRQNRIGDAGAASLAESLGEHVRHLQSFGGVCARFELDLEQNRIKEAGTRALEQALRNVTQVGVGASVQLLMHGNPVDPACLAACLAASTRAVSGGEAAAADEDTERSTADPRLLFESKAEGLLW